MKENKLLIMMIGLPCTGKSYLVRTLLDDFKS